MTLKRSLLSERSGRLSDNKGVNAFPFEEFSHEHVNFFALWLKKSVKVHQIPITIGWAIFIGFTAFQSIEFVGDKFRH